MKLFKKYYYINSDQIATLFDNFLKTLKISQRNKCSVEILTADFDSFMKKYKKY